MKKRNPALVASIAKFQATKSHVQAVGTEATGRKRVRRNEEGNLRGHRRRAYDRGDRVHMLPFVGVLYIRRVMGDNRII